MRKVQETISKDNGKTIKIHSTVYDIISCMMTGADSFNETISKILSDYLKTHKKERDLVQSILESRDSTINLKDFTEEGVYE